MRGQIEESSTVYRVQVSQCGTSSLTVGPPASCRRQAPSCLVLCFVATLAQRGPALGSLHIGERGGLNLYGMVGNNAVSGIDPLGLWNAWNPFTWGVAGNPGENPWNPFDRSAAWGATGSGLLEGGHNVAMGFRNAAEGVGESAAFFANIVDPNTRAVTIEPIRALFETLWNDPCAREMLINQGIRNVGDILSDPDRLSEALADLSAGAALGIVTGSGAQKLLNELKMLGGLQAANRTTRFKIDDIADGVPDYTGRAIDQRLLNDIVFNDPALKRVNLTEYPTYNPNLRPLGQATLQRGGSFSEIGPRAFSSRSEIIDTIIHEDLHIRLFNRNKVFDSIDAEEAYIRSVTERFRKGKGL